MSRSFFVLRVFTRPEWFAETCACISSQCFELLEGKPSMLKRSRIKITLTLIAAFSISQYMHYHPRSTPRNAIYNIQR